MLKRYAVADGRYVVVHPGCGGHGWQREFPAEKYAELIEWIAGSYGLTVVLTGSGSEAEVVREIENRVSKGVVSLQGRLGLNDMAALLEGAKLLISGNTGIMHLACAAGTRCVALHGPTNPLTWGPLGEGHTVVKSRMECSPCLVLGYEYACKKRTCMESISVEEVRERLREVLDD
jgi:ADP-heptose:LPS heptosyltransferase